VKIEVGGGMLSYYCVCDGECVYVCGLQAGISQKCVMELKHAMLERAHSVDLDPEIEKLCIGDLARFCSDKMRKNEVGQTLLIVMI